MHPDIAIKNFQKAVTEDLGEELNQMVAGFFADKMRKLDDEIEKTDKRVCSNG